jgi:integrase
LADCLPDNRRIRLQPLLRYLGCRGVAPHDVSAADLEGYREAIISNRLRKAPEKTWDSLVWAWNACVDDLPQWPRLRIERQVRREVYVLPWSAFPESLSAEVDAFLLRLSGANLDEDGPLRSARPATLKTRAYQLRVAASALVHKGQDPLAITSIAELLTFANYQLILRFLLDRHGGKTSPQVGQIAGFLKDVVRHWLKADDETVERFRRLAGRLSLNHRGMTAKNRDRLRSFDDPATVAAFLELPHKLRREVEAGVGPLRPRALKAQYAVAIALLQAVPLRIANLCALDVRRNLIQRGKRLYLVIEGDATKNGEPVDFELPAPMVDLLAWYVREHRPVLLGVASDALFPGEGGKAKHPGTLAGQIKATVQRHVGVSANPHLFRHIAGKIFLDARPGEYETVRQVLRHKSIATTTAFYAGAETRTAGRHFQSVVAGLRSTAGGKA